MCSLASIPRLQMLFRKSKSAPPDEDAPYRIESVGPKSFFVVDWSDPVIRRAVLACLVSAVYALQWDNEKKNKGQQSQLAEPWWKFFHYDLQDVIWSNNGLRINGALFHWRRDLPKPPKAPLVVIAFRGTQTLASDYAIILKIFNQQLHKTERFLAAYEAVKRAVSTYGAENICLAGHSSGAALSLFSARMIAMEDVYLETHAFNPPFSSFLAPFQSIMSTKTYEGMQAAYTAIKAGLVALLKNESGRKKSEEAFQMIRNWYPNLYVNTKDPICCGYAEYFFSHKKDNSKGRIAKMVMHHETITGALFQTATNPYHLIPSAMLHVCQSAGSASEAHSLIQWWSLELPVQTHVATLTSSEEFS